MAKKKTENKKKPIDITNQFDTHNLDNIQIDVNAIDVSGVSNKAPTRKSEKKQNNDSDDDSIHIPTEIGILALRNIVVFPGTVNPLAIGRAQSQNLIDNLPESSPDRIIGVLTQKDPDVDNPGFKDLFTTGTIVTVLKKLRLPDGHKSLVVHGLVRFRVTQWIAYEPFLRAKIEVIESKASSSKALAALTASVRTMAQKMIDLSPNIPDEVQVILHNIDEPGALADFLAANINIPMSKKQEILECIDVEKRLQKLSLDLASQIELLQLSADIQNKVHNSIDKSQREYYLQEQLKAIQTELGLTDQKSEDIKEMRKRLIKANMPEKVFEEAVRELDRLSRISSMSPEYSVSRNYIEWLADMPWDISTSDKLNLISAKRILNADHYDLEKVKKRIIEYLAVKKLNPKGRSPILCFAGPPGVGKTSLGKSIARSMGRNFIRMSLGGMRDEAELRGHRRTYIGALPGRIIQEIRKCGSNNPVFMLDEIDKIGQDFRGDPASALLEILDPEQNFSFTDHYLEQPFDLSKIMFIATANYMGTVPPALRDRMEVLELPGYTAIDKMHIAKKYLVPRQLKENGLSDKIMTIKDNALETIIESYTREAGVRELERKIAAVCRAIAAKVASNKCKSATINPKNLDDILGPAMYESELALRTSTPGVVTGLAYTPVGGEILFIESTFIPGKGNVILTGQLGDVMKESASTALSVLKSMALAEKKPRKGTIALELYNILNQDNPFAKYDIHIHVPAGAVPKDGPSAGLAMFSAMSSLVTGRAARTEVAMTGEITLRGIVLPIGGVKEKLLAAKQAGIKTVILPKRNEKDLVDLSKDVTKGMKFVFVQDGTKALETILE
ncbi:MAG: endopeptidase La [Phycisphaerae bacterium]|nr:endopeptidase La [Phycisphaerae bacterium]